MHRCWTLFWLAAVATCAVACGDSSGSSNPGSDNGTVSDNGGYVIPNPSGKAHGEVCTSNDECMYRTCYKSPHITGGAFGICTKDCTSGPGSVCSDDDGGGVAYHCLRFGPHDGEDMLNFCVPTCSGTLFCQAYDSRFNTCEAVVGVRKYCRAL